MANGKKSGAKKTSRPRNQITRRPKAISNFDGQNLLVSQYFEVELTQPAVGVDSVIAYSIACDVKNCVLNVKPVGGTMSSKHGAELASTSTGHATMAFERFGQFKELFRQYKVNAVSISVTADRNCGLDNPIIFLTDKGDDVPVNDIGKAMAQPHKQHMLTESRRTCKYGWKPKTAQEKEYLMTHSASNVGANDLTTLKVLQEIEPKADGKCTHKVAIRMLCTLKDGKALN